MEDFIGFLFIWLMFEFIFWGVIYATGSVLIFIISFGKWVPDSIIRSNSGRVSKKQSGFGLINRSGQIYLGAWGVCILGLSFWTLIVIYIVLI